MKVSAWVSVSDLVLVQKTKIETIIDTVFGKKQVFQTHSLKQIFASLKQAGVDGIELLVPLLSSDQNIDEVRNITKKYNMPVLSIHQSLTSLTAISLSEITRLCHIANLFSVKVITVHSGALEKKLFDVHFINTLKTLQKKHKISFSIENMPKTVLALGKEYMYKGNEFASTIERARLSMTLDTTHLAQAGGDIIPFYKDNKERIINIHFSNFKKHWLNSHLLLQNFTHLPLSDGELPVREFLKLLKQTHYSGLVTMEINGDLTQLCESAKIIKRGFN